MFESLSEGGQIIVFLAIIMTVILIIGGIYEHSSLSERDPEDHLKDRFGDGE